MSLDLGFIGGMAQASAQQSAADSNARNARQTNKQNLQMFEESRGQGGSAVMPLYLKNRDGTLFEDALGKNLVDDYNKTRSTVPDFQASNDSYKPMIAASTDEAGKIFNGGVKTEMEQNLAPVKEARAAGVRFKRQAAIDSLNKTMGEIDAMRAGKGFTDDSSGAQLMKFNANKQAADAVGGASLQAQTENAQDERTIGDAATNLKLANLNLPYNLANENLAFEKAPHDAYIDEIMKGMQPLSFLRIGGSQPFDYKGMPTIQPNMGAGGAAVAGLAGNAGVVGTSALRQWLNSNNNYASNATGSTDQWGTPTGDTSGQSFTTGAGGGGDAEGAVASEAGFM